jgi:hypothetical protein
MEGSILALLVGQESLGFDQIVAHLAEPADAVRSALTDLRVSGFVGVLSIGETEGAHDGGHVLLAAQRSGARGAASSECVTSR